MIAFAVGEYLVVVIPPAAIPVSAEPLSNTAPLNKFLKTPKTVNIGAGTSLTVENNDAASGNVAFVKEGTIHVSVGGTFHVKNNTKLQLNVLGIF